MSAANSKYEALSRCVIDMLVKQSKKTPAEIIVHDGELCFMKLDGKPIKFYQQGGCYSAVPEVCILSKGLWFDKTIGTSKNKPYILVDAHDKKEDINSLVKKGQFIELDGKEKDEHVYRLVKEGYKIYECGLVDVNILKTLSPSVCLLMN
jgi:hypothetical protein